MLNPIVSGGLTGALLAVRSGPMVCISELISSILFFQNLSVDRSHQLK